MTYRYCYDEVGKSKAHATDKTLLRAVAKALHLNPGDYELRANRGGVAVWGEVTLHTDRIYIHVTRGNDCGVLVRSCKGRRDFTGGVNRYLPYALLKSSAFEFAMRAQDLTGAHVFAN